MPTNTEIVLAKFAWRRLGTNQKKAMARMIDNVGLRWPSGFKIGSDANTEVVIRSLETNGLVSRDTGPTPVLTVVGILVWQAGQGYYDA